MKSKRRICDCESCHVNSTERLYSSGPEDAEIMVLDTYPDRTEIVLQEHLSGGPGQYFNHLMGKVKLRKHRIYFTKVLQCSISSFDYRSELQRESIEICSKNLQEEIKSLRNLKVIVPISQAALDILDINAKLNDCRGSVYDKEKYVIIPTYHPSFIMRGRVKEQSTWINDWNKIKEIVKNGYKRIKEDFNIFPTKAEITEFSEEHLEKGTPIAVDIETTGIYPTTSNIVVTGMGVSKEKGISFPKLRKGGYEYWTNGGRAVASDCLKSLLIRNPTIYQNALFDVRFLEEKGYKVGNIQDDILLLHHCLHPELPHNLGYITSVYGQTPYWKDTLKKSPERILEMPDEELRTYNIRDCVVLNQILPKLTEEVKKQGTYHIYRNISIPLIRPVLEMMNTGMPVSRNRLNKWKRSLKKQIATLEEEMKDIADLPEDFSFTSTADMQFLLYDKPQKSHKTMIKKYSVYQEEDCKLKRNTKVFKELSERYNRYVLITPLPPPKILTPKKTTTGGLSVDEDALTTYKVAVNKRLSMINSFKTFRAGHKRELEILEIQEKFLVKLLQYRKVSKLESTYTKFTIRKDRFHYSFKIHGTNTGRLSSQGA